LAENHTKRAKVEEITSWYQYRKHFEKRLDDILPENQRNDKRAYDLASGQIYDEMLQYLSGISRVSLRKRTQRTKPIYKLFSVIGEDKIKRIKTYSANKLSKLTDVQIDTIKKHFIAIPRDQKSRTHMTEASISPNNILTESISLYSSQENNQDSKSRSENIAIASEVNISTKSISTDSEKIPDTEESISRVNKSRPPISILPNDPEEKRKAVINKVLEQFPYLSSKYSRTEGTTLKGYKNHDYFDFNSSVSCPICNKDHKKENIRDNVEGEWGSGDYVNTKTYRLKCWEANQNSIQIVTVKA